jgi:hypothetical protein
MLNILVYWTAWILFVGAQAQNSVTSKTNGLPAGWAGIKIWLIAHAMNLVNRAFWSAVACGFFIHYVATKVAAAGLPITTTTIAAVAGYCANGLLYQFFGLFPGLRVEVADFAPPANSEIVPQSAQNANPAKTGDKTV